MQTAEAPSALNYPAFAGKVEQPAKVELSFANIGSQVIGQVEGITRPSMVPSLVAALRAKPLGSLKDEWGNLRLARSAYAGTAVTGGAHREHARLGGVDVSGTPQVGHTRAGAGR